MHSSFYVKVFAERTKHGHDIAVAVTEMIRIPFAGRGSVNLLAAGSLAFWHMFLTAVGRIRHPGERGDPAPT